MDTQDQTGIVPSIDLPPAWVGMGREEFFTAMLRAWEAAHAGDRPWDDDDLIERFISSCSRTGSAETKSAYAREISAFQLWRWGRSTARQQCDPPPLRSVSPQEAQDWVDFERSRVDAGQCKPRSYNRRIAAVSALFRWASEPSRSGFTGIPRNPLPSRCMLEVAKRPRPLTNGDLDRIVDAITAAGDLRDLALIRGAYLLGARVSELAALRWGDIEELEDGGQIHLIGKGSKARTVRVSAATLALFLAIKPADATEDGWVFPSGRRAGEHLTRQAIGSRVRHWGRVALGSDARVWPTRLRSSHATHALRSGAHLLLLQGTLGHRSAESTAYYAAVAPTDSSSMRLG